MQYYIDHDQNILRVCYGMLEKFSIEGKTWCMLSHRISDWEIEEKGLGLISDEDAQRMLGHKMLSSLNYLRLKELIAFVRGYEVEWVPARRNNDGVIILGFPNYDERVFEILDLLGFDEDSYENENKLPRRIAQMTVMNIRTYFTVISRQERFCTGVISDAVQDRTIFRLLLRLTEIRSTLAER